MFNGELKALGIEVAMTEICGQIFESADSLRHEHAMG